MKDKAKIKRLMNRVAEGDDHSVTWVSLLLEKDSEVLMFYQGNTKDLLALVSVCLLTIAKKASRPLLVKLLNYILEQHEIEH